MIAGPIACFGIDWSGAKGPRQAGIQIAQALPGRGAPIRVTCPDHALWGRDAVFDWLLTLADGLGSHQPALPGANAQGGDSEGAASKGPVLVGIDFAFAHPFDDEGAYYPGLQDPNQPRDAAALWRMVDEVAADDPHFYGGRMFTLDPCAGYYLSPHNHRAPYYVSRRRATEKAARAAGRSPSPTFKAIGADNVATGSMAGMRLLHRLKSVLGSRLAVWPFDQVTPENWPELSLILVEIFPSLYFHAAGFNPARRAAGDPAFLSAALAAYDSSGVPAGFTPRGGDADEADAMIAAAALRFFAAKPGCWCVPPDMADAARQEGWIFGVGMLRAQRKGGGCFGG